MLFKLYFTNYILFVKTISCNNILKILINNCNYLAKFKIFR